MTSDALDRARELNRDMPFDGCDPETHTEAANLLGEMAAEIDRLRQRVAELEAAHRMQSVGGAECTLRYLDQSI